MITVPFEERRGVLVKSRVVIGQRKGLRVRVSVRAKGIPEEASDVEKEDVGKASLSAYGVSRQVQGLIKSSARLVLANVNNGLVAA